MEEGEECEDAQREESIASDEEDEGEEEKQEEEAAAPGEMVDMAEEEESTDGDGDGEDGDLLYRQIPIEGYESKLFEVTLPEKGSKRERVWVFYRAVEFYLWGSEARTSNLYHCLEELGFEVSIRNFSKSTYRTLHMKSGQFQGLMAIFNTWRKQVDPLASNKARQVSLIPRQVAATVALHRTVRSFNGVNLLKALGQTVPQSVQNAIERSQHEAAGELNLSLPDVEEENPEAGEMFEIALGQELLQDFDPEGACGLSLVEEQKASRQYALQNPSTVLTRQIEEMKLYRTRVLNANRVSNKVLEITVDSDVSTMLRWLGWVSSTFEGAAGALDFSIFRHPECTDMLERFCHWLVEERGCSYGTVAGYCNSLLTLAQFAVGEVHETVDEQHDEGVTYSLFNLRSQAESQYRDDSRYRPLDPNWISWEDAQRTRIAALKKFKEAKSTARSQEQRKALLKLAEDCCIIAFHTYQPPDRVGVIRRLAIGESLRKDEDGWAIDCTKFRHKTSKFYGDTNGHATSTH